MVNDNNNININKDDQLQMFSYKEKIIENFYFYLFNIKYIS